MCGTRLNTQIEYIIHEYFKFKKVNAWNEKLTARALLEQAGGVSINSRHICLLDLVLLDHSECLRDGHIPFYEIISVVLDLSTLLFLA
jgi:hypothetical protein